jgi:capsular exopolysaccharide synthesis family protein
MIEPSPNTSGRPGVSVQHYLHVLRRWKWTTSFFFLTVIAGVLLFSFLVPPVYRAKGTIWIDEQMKILPFDDIQRYDPTGLSPQSYSQLLQSRALAAKVIEKNRLYENPLFLGRIPKGKKLPGPSDPVFMEKLVIKFQKSITVIPIERTRLLEVAFSGRDAQFASVTLNALIDEYFDMIIRQRYEASEQATQFLNSQITTVRAQIEESEKKLSEYGSAKDILPLTPAETPTVTKLADVNRALTEATIDRVNKYDTYNQLKSGTLTDLPGGQANSPVQRYRDQYMTLSQEYARRLATVKPEYPEMQRLKSEIDSVKEALQSEQKKLAEAAYTDYQAALNKERSLQRLLDQARGEALKDNSNSIIYNSLRIELENKKSLLEALSKRQSETDLSSQLKSLEAANIWVVDRASLPLKPEFPNKRKNMLMGLLVGLAGGLALALGLEHLNNTVRTSRDVTASTGLPILGVIPSFDAEANPRGPKSEFVRISNILFGRGEADRKKPPAQKGKTSTLVPEKGKAIPSGEEPSKNVIELIVTLKPQSIQAESFRSIRTTLLVSSPPGKIKTLLVTSPLAREGKSATTSNLGIALAQANKRVVIVDADLRKPKQSRIFGLNSGWGLTHYVSSFIDAADVVKPTQFPNLFLIGSGPIPANPLELLTSEKMDTLIAFLKRSFDYILIDAPPLLAVSDALVVGPMIDGALLVTRRGQTPIPALKQAKQKLDAHKLKCLGVILNGVNLIEQDGYYAKQYYQYAKPE